MLQQLVDLLPKPIIAPLLLLVVLAVTVGLQIALGYTKPNIGYQLRSHRDRDHTFFIRNLDAIHYRQAMHVIVSGHGLRYLEVQAGPWSRHKPVKIDDIDGQVRVRVVLDEVPEEAAFAIRVRCPGAVPQIEIADDSPLRPRGFRRPIARFTARAKLRYYGLRYAIGILGFLAIYLGGLYLKYPKIEPADWVTAGITVIVSGFAFALVVPLSGKRTIVGYVTSIDTDHHWGDRPSSGATAVVKE